MGEVVDLDALVPESITVKLSGQEIKLNPPTLSQLLKLSSIGEKLVKAEGLQPDQLEEILADIRGVLALLFPELADKELNLAQIVKLISVVTEMTVPKDAKELKARGITPGGDDDPKAP